MALRALLVAIIGILIVLGVRKIWRDWTGQFKRVADEDRAAIRERDRAERQRPDVIDLKRDADGTYRPPEDRDDRPPR